MEIRNNVSQPAFQANVDIHLASELRKDAARMSKSMLERFDNQLGLVSKWGDKTSEITASFDMGSGTRSLALYNNDISSSYGAGLPQRGSLLESFLNLRKKDVTDAESNLAEHVMDNKFKLIYEAMNNKSLEERIAGKANPTEEEFAAAIDKLTEEQVTNLRFNLDTKPAETGKILDFVG